MRDELSIAPTPVNESCEQLGRNYDPVKARAECRAFLNQLRRQFGEPPEGAELRLKANAHDFGTYYDVIVTFPDDDRTAIEYALKLEGNTPEYWDAESVAELEARGFQVTSKIPGGFPLVEMAIARRVVADRLKVTL
jgi:hypothetical protein